MAVATFEILAGRRPDVRVSVSVKRLNSGSFPLKNSNSISFIETDFFPRRIFTRSKQASALVVPEIFILLTVR